jgi:hypothetical protein
LQAWQIYMTWYTWFFGANLIVLGWLFTQSAEPLQQRHVRLLCIGWIVFNVTGVASTIRLMMFSRRATRKGAQLSSRLADTVSGGVAFDPLCSFPTELGDVGALGNLISLAINIGLWTYLMFDPPIR